MDRDTLEEMYYCPICNSVNTSDDCTTPETMTACNTCGSEWIKETREVTLNGREVK